MVLEMPSENRQCQGRGNMGGQLIPDLACIGWKRFWSGHWCFPQWCRYGYRRGRPEWSWRCVPWKNLSEVQRLLVVQYLESSCGNFEIDSMAYREPVQAGEASYWEKHLTLADRGRNGHFKNKWWWWWWWWVKNKYLMICNLKFT